jgi:hypothetical protein
MHSLEGTEGMEIGVHGSYCSMDSLDSLAAEFTDLRQLGFRPLGGRQHWLRFSLAQLLTSMQRADAAYDASIGWPHQMGYRAGACFPFPPYDFEQERPASFLELPLVVMDAAVADAGNGNGAGSEALAEVMRQSRLYGWGGISVLWHPTAFGGGQYPAEVGEVFWKMVAAAQSLGEAWISAAPFVRTVWKRYESTGLLPTWRWQ